MVEVDFAPDTDQKNPHLITDFVNYKMYWHVDTY